jgi:hypothetical protein
MFAGKALCEVAMVSRFPALSHRSAMVDPEHCRALDLLAGSRDGCPEALFLAHGFTQSNHDIRRRGT